MNTLLQLKTSIYSDTGESSRLADQLVAALRTRNPDTTLIVRDLARDPVPHLTADRFQAFITPADKRTPAQRAVVEYSDGLIGELQRADTIVLALPMYNFSVPSTLKAYFDHIARAGVTFRYTEHGPVGLLKDKKVYVVTTRGGKYEGTPADTETYYVRQFLGFLGVEDMEFIYAEGLALSEPSKQAALHHARNAIARRGVPEPVAGAAT